MPFTSTAQVRHEPYGCDPVVVAERGNLDADLAQGLVDRETVDQRVGLAVDGYLKHGSISVG